MKIHLIILAVLAIILPSAARALTVEEAFVAAPMDIFPLLDKNTRLDMIDYFKSGSTKGSRNLLYGQSRITAMTDNQLDIVLTPASTASIIAMPLEADTVLVLIHTYATPVEDSTVGLFSSAWEPLDARAFTPPSLADWMRPGTKKGALREAEALIPFMLYSCQYSPATLCFVFTNNMEQYMGKEAYEPLKPLLRDYIVYAFTTKGCRLLPLGPDAANPLQYE